MAASALPSALRGITATKIVELKKQRKDFEDAKAAIEDKVNLHRKDGNVIGETRALIDGTRRLEGVYLVDRDSEDDEDFNLPQTGTSASKLYTYSRLLKQSAVDPALPQSIISDIQRDLTKDLELKSIQHQHAELYAKLVTEYVSVDTDVDMTSGPDVSQFQPVGREEMHEQRKAWEEIVFGATDVDEDGIQTYLTNLFTSKSQVKRAYETLRKRFRMFSVNLATQDVFTVDSLKIYIKGLMATDLLNEEKRAILKTFTSNKAVLQEVADVLSMRFKSLDTWQYTTNNGAILVEQRRQLNDKYRFYLDEDVLDALLIHAIGMKWAVEFREALKEFQSSHAWSRHHSEIPHKDRQLREWFLGSRGSVTTVASRRDRDYTDNYFMTLLPDSVEAGPRAYDDSDGEEDARDPTRKSPLETKHSLLHLLVTEVIVARHLHPEIEHTVIRSDFKWFGPSLPHASIFNVLEFFGVSDLWLSFFRKFLATPLRFVQDGPGGQVRTRQRGIPMSMALADVIGEAVLFVMDFAVNSSTKGYLYRLHDDFWYWNDKDSCRLAWQQMRHFARVMGMSFNEEKTGSVVFPSVVEDSEDDLSDGKSTDSEPVSVSGLPTGDVRWGFLKLDVNSCRFKIDQAQVDEHINELKVQLKAHSTSLFDYIQAYNSYVARFFTNNFGKPSFGFGRVHIDDMISTLGRIHAEMYANGRVADHLSTMIEERFGVKPSNIPDGFWFFPVANGGMEIRNPLVPLVNMRETFRRTPERILRKAMEDEDADYVAAKHQYDRKNRGWGMAGTNSALKAALNMSGSEEFMSKQEYLKHREELSMRLLWAYEQLLTVPEEEPLNATPGVLAWIATLQGGHKKGASIGNWTRMTPYWQSIVSSYGKDICDKFGSLKMVEPAQVPLGVVSVMKSSKIRWQG